jgi:hypothetical protein
LSFTRFLANTLNSQSHPKKPCWLPLLAVLALFVACEPKREPRVYVAPKEDTVFVVLPNAQASVPQAGGKMPPMGMPGMSGSSIPNNEKRILGAIFPLNGYGYFLKITDTIDRIEKARGPFETIVAQFTADPETSAPNFPLPEGWSMQPGDSIADAKVAISIADGEKPVMMTVTKLTASTDPADWPTYLREQFNRWRGQLQLAPQSIEELMKQLVEVPRAGSSIPAYVFDQNGAASPAPSLSKASDPASAATTNSSEPNVPANSPMPSDSSRNTATTRPELKYDLPDGWELLPPQNAFRIATLRIKSSGGEGEVAISQAVDSPLENCKMWSQQILKTDDATVIDTYAEKAVATAEMIPSGDREAKLYTIRLENDPEAVGLLIAAIPAKNSQAPVFVKLKSSNRIADEQKPNLLRFVKSLREE